MLAADGPPDIGRIQALAQKYQLEMDFSTVGELEQRYNVWLGGPRAAHGDRTVPITRKEEGEHLLNACGP